ncbi:MAG TPA: transposase [Paraburkholderia sp.]|jgi:transposase|nr:transposase [Paraburkholderia sp.]
MQILPLSDEAWYRVRHLFGEAPKQRVGRPSRDPRDVLNAILWVLIHNEKWHRLPAHFPPSQTCYIKWLKWRRDGLMAQIGEALGVDALSAPD